ncbi:MAG: hypothetical protein OXN17_04295 [Candidatus Poribacteria bacterium]|nr:hypothetical protein [Candidatus Poribacteria bacterium]MDE0502884.1 hypothetical protein [Candidatus Poribacteria bacterium]
MSQPGNSSRFNQDETSAGVSLQPMSFADILDTTFSMYRRHFPLFLGISAVYFTSHVVLTVYWHWITDLCDIAVPILTYAGSVYASAQICLAKPVTVQSAFGQVMSRLMSFVGSAVLWLLVVLALSFTVIGIPVAIFLGTRWGFFPLTVLAENYPAAAALRRSGELVKGTWWRVFSIMLAIAMIALTIELIFVFFSTSIIALSGNTGEMDFMELIRWCVWGESHDEIKGALHLLHAINTAISALTGPITPIGFTLLYFDQRVRKEGFDIEWQMTKAVD